MGCGCAWRRPESDLGLTPVTPARRGRHQNAGVVWANLRTTARTRHGVIGAMLLAALTPAAADDARTLPAAHWEGQGLTLDVRVAAGEASVAAEQMTAAAHLAIGIVAMPMVVLNPPAALGWPFYMLLAAPWQATFNARAETLGRVLAAEALPAAVVDAVRAQWPASEARGPRSIDLQIGAYGLATRSGKRLEAFEAGEDLCLQAHAQLAQRRGEVPARQQTLVIGTDARTPGLPPPTCMSMARWAENDGRRLREALGELAELLAALVMQAAEEAP